MFKSIIQIHTSAGKSVYAGEDAQDFGRNKAYVILITNDDYELI